MTWAGAKVFRATETPILIQGDATGDRGTAEDQEGQPGSQQSDHG